MSRNDSRHVSKESRRAKAQHATNLGHDKPIRAVLVAGFARRVHVPDDAPGGETRWISNEWDQLLDCRAGPRVVLPDGSVARVPLPLGQSLLGGPAHPPFYDRHYLNDLLTRTRESLGLTEREARALAAIEALRADEIRWEDASGAAERRYVTERPEIRRSVESDARAERREFSEPFKVPRGVHPADGPFIRGRDGRRYSWWSQEAYDERRREFEENRSEHAEKYGTTRPKEFWHQAVRELRRDVGLTAAEIQELAKELFVLWEATPQAVAKAIVAAAPAGRQDGPRTSHSTAKRRPALCERCAKRPPASRFKTRWLCRECLTK